MNGKKTMDGFAALMLGLLGGVNGLQLLCMLGLIGGGRTGLRIAGLYPFLSNFLLLPVLTAGLVCLGLGWYLEYRSRRQVGVLLLTAALFAQMAVTALVLLR